MSKIRDLNVNEDHNDERPTEDGLTTALYERIARLEDRVAALEARFVSARSRAVTEAEKADAIAEADE